MTSEPATGRLETLLAEASWLEALARALVGDREEARDLVQEVWVAAAERAPSRIERPRAWLAEVLRNALRSRRRAQGPRESRERARARDAAVSGTGDVVARAEAQRALVEHVLALDEPWRSTVLLHFFDALSCEEIARRTGTNGSTVRNRLAHALSILRALLERSRGTDWMAGILVLAPATGPSRSSAPASGSSGAFTGAQMTIAVILLAGLGLLRWSPWSTEARPADVSVADERSPSSDAGQRTSPLPVAGSGGRTALAESIPVLPDPVASEVDLADQDGLPVGTFVGIVLEDGSPSARRGTVEISRSPGLRRTYLAGDGLFRFDGLDTETHGIRLTLDGLPEIRTNVFLPEDRGERREIHVGSGVLSGSVWDEDGRPVPGAQITLTWTSDDLAREKSVIQETVRGTSDSDGRYRFDGLPAGKFAGGLRLLESDGDDEMHYFRLEPALTRGESRRLDHGVPRPWPRWTGTLRARTGAVHSGGETLFLESPSGNPSLTRRAVAEDGTFDIRLPPGHYAFEIRMPDGTRAPLGEADITGDVERDLVLPGARVAGRVFRAETGALVQERARFLGVSARYAGPEDRADRDAWVDEHGSFVIDALEPGVYLLNTHPLVVDGGRDSLRFELLAGQDELVLDVFVRAP